MSDYNFLNSPSTNVTFNTSFSGDTFTLSTATTFGLGDVVYLPVSDTTGVFGYCFDPSGKVFRYDTEIYGTFTGSQNITGCEFWDASNDLLYDDVTSYRIGSQIERGLYSESYKTYSSSVDYTLIIDNKRREFFTDTQYKSVKDLVLSNDVVFADGCKEIAYGVGFAGNDFEVFNNKFKSSLEFNIATR